MKNWIAVALIITNLTQTVMFGITAYYIMQIVN